MLVVAKLSLICKCCHNLYRYNSIIHENVNRNNMNRDKKKELYREFLIKCTRNPNSEKNYTDFKRINECLASLFPDRENVSLLDFDDAIEFSEIVERLEKMPLYINYNNTCKNQYSNAVAFYQCFLNAKNLFANIQRENNEIGVIVELPLQQIFYGAPGTGKSHIVKQKTQGESVVRTTFHPDSDYSTFVGAYKPTTKKVAIRDVTGKVIIENGLPVKENRIEYKFVEQAFLKAYIKAWEFFANVEEGAEP